MPRLLGRWPRPLIIAHRGACGVLPEQTLEAFDLAVRQGADAIEFDVVPTADGVLLARHESELSVTTNVADLPRFAARRASRVIDGAEIEGWFTEQFTAEEIRDLRARQRFTFRDHACDDRFQIATLDDVLRWRSSMPRPIELFIEIKHPSYFASIGLSIPKLLLQSFSRAGLSKRAGGVILKSFETRALRDLRGVGDLPLIQLLDAPDARPFDFTLAGDDRTYAELCTPNGLAQLAAEMDGIGAWKRLIVPAQSTDADGVAQPQLRLAPPTDLLRDAHAAGLFVSAWTFRDEPQFLAADYAGDPRREYAQFLQLGIDALITDFPATAHAAATLPPDLDATPSRLRITR